MKSSFMLLYPLFISFFLFHSDYGDFDIYIHRLQGVALVGGVACNKFLQSEMRSFLQSSHQLTLSVPIPSLLRDNAAMIAWVGIERLLQGSSDMLPIQDKKQEQDSHSFHFKGRGKGGIVKARWSVGEYINITPPPSSNKKKEKKKVKEKNIN